MPFKSKAQRRKFYAMAGRGEMPMATVKRWERETPKGAKLPEKVGENFQRWTTPDIYGMLDARQDEDAAPGMASGGMAGVTTTANVGPYQVPLGGMLRRAVPGWGSKGQKKKRK